MAEPALVADDPEFIEPDVSHLVTEDDTPVDNWFQMKQQDLLAEILRISWEDGRPFVSGTDVGLFYAVKEAIVPDFLLSVGVEAPENFQEKNRRSYFVWIFGKPPEIVVEIVSNKKGGEDSSKLELYSQIKVPYYVVFDPMGCLSPIPLRIWQLSGASYVEKAGGIFPEIGLGLKLWEGEFDGLKALWLRWYRSDSGELLETGQELARRQRQQVDEEKQRADQEKQRADEEKQRADEEMRRRQAMEARLRALGVDPDQDL